MDETSPEGTDKVAPWAIKAITKRASKIATEAARKEGVTVGQWLERLILTWDADGGPVAGPAQPASDPVALLNAAAAYMQGTASVRAAGLKINSRALGQVQAAAEAQLRASRGLPALQQRKQPLAIDKPAPATEELV